MKTIELRPGFVSVNEGAFDSRNRHLRQVNLLGDLQFWMTQGPSVDIKVITSFNGSDPQYLIGWRYEVGPRSVTPLSPFTNNALYPAAGFADDKAASL